jgi:hypothetical protein
MGRWQPLNGIRKAAALFSQRKKNRATVSLTRLDLLVVELPSKVSKCFVRISHAVDVFSSRNRGAFFVVSCNEFVSKF